MPTARPRHSITETDEISRALEAAAERWPEDRGRPGRLLLDLVREGHQAINADAQRASEERHAAISATGGALTGAYPAGYLEQIRADWPE